MVGIAKAADGAESCPASPPSREFPRLDESAVSHVIAVVHYRAACYLEQFPECREENLVCMDPPPFEVEAEVVSTVFGPALPRVIRFATTSHYGIPREVEPDALWAVHLVTDGASIVMGRYQTEPVGIAGSGRMVIPVYPDDIGWLPCSQRLIREPMTFNLPSNHFAVSLEDFDAETLQAHPDHFRIDGDQVRPTMGLPIDSLAALLGKERQDPGGGFKCLRSEETEQ